MVLPTQDAPRSSLHQLHRHGDLDWLQGSSWAGTLSREHWGESQVFWEDETPMRGEENGARLWRMLCGWDSMWLGCLCWLQEWRHK